MTIKRNRIATDSYSNQTLPTSIVLAINDNKTLGHKRAYFSALLTNIFLFCSLGVFLLSACSKTDALMPPASTPVNNTSAQTPPVAPVVPVELTEKATCYVAPNGSDNNNGDITHPFATLTKAWSVIAPGNLIYMRGGTYRFGSNVDLSGKDGKAGSLTKVWAYPGEAPVIDFSEKRWTAATPAVNLQTNYLHFKGIRITNMIQSAAPGDIHTGLGIKGSNSIVENCVVDHINGYGFKIDGNPSNITFLNCDAHHCADPLNGYEGANGFNITLNSGTGHKLEGCRAWLNGDDGFDTYGANGYMEFKNCWSFKNGYLDNGNTAGDGEGYKIGPSSGSVYSTIKRKFTNCLAFDNAHRGFAQSAEADKAFPCEVYNCAAFRNGGEGFSFGVTGVANIAKNNVSYQGYGTSWFASGIVTNNSWNGKVSVSNTDFVSLDASPAYGARQADGSLPVLSFMHLASGSDLINAGVDVGLPFNGSAPDMGAFD